MGDNVHTSLALARYAGEADRLKGQVLDIELAGLDLGDIQDVVHDTRKQATGIHDA
jgi:hypothetical protein